MHVIHRHVKTVSPVQVKASFSITATVRSPTLELTAKMVNGVLFHFLQSNAAYDTEM